MRDQWHLVDALVAARGQALKRYAYLLGGSDDRADDLVQEALTRALSRRLPDDPHELERYVRRIIVNLVVDEARRATRWTRLLPRVAERPESRDRGPEVVDRITLDQALAALPPGQRACLVLHYYEDLPIAEIATLLGRGTGTVKSQLHDARKALARHWHDTTRAPEEAKGDLR